MKRKGQGETGDHISVSLCSFGLREVLEKNHMKKGKAYGTSY